MHNEAMMKRLERACDDFLKTYAEDAPARVAREAFGKVLEEICVAMLELHADCDTKHRSLGAEPHQLTGAIYEVMEGGVFTRIELNFRNKAMVGVKVNKQEAVAQMKGIPMGLDEMAQQQFATLFLVQPQKLDLEDIERMGVKPHALVSQMKKRVDTVVFVQETKNKATQPAGMA